MDVAAGQGKTRKESRTEKEYSDFLYQTLGPLTLLIGIAVCYSSGIAIDVADENNLACQLAMTDEEVQMIVPPAARLLDKAKFNPKIRKAIVSSTDSLGLMFAVGGYLTRIYSISKELKNVQTSSQVRPTRTTSQPAASQPPAGAEYTPGLNGLSGFGAHIAS